MARLIQIVGIVELAVICGAIAASVVPWAQERWRIEETRRENQRIQLARRDLFSLGGQGLNEWRLDSGSWCPPDAAAIARHMDHLGSVDPWGTPYQIRCIESGDRPGEDFVIFSAGPDRMLHTRDDIHREESFVHRHD